MLGGITLVLYGMIGLLGAKIWKESGVDLGRPVNLVPVAAGLILAIGDAQLQVTDTFTLSGISLVTLVVVAGYHLARAVAPREQRDDTGDTAGHDPGHRAGTPAGPA